MAAVMGGCSAAMLRPFSPEASPNYALLSLAVEKGSHASAYDGILSVDGADVPKELRQQAYVAGGSRRVGYECPGWITMDGPSTIDRYFEPGKRYRLMCGSKPALIIELDEP